jgi:hypothetical protein
LTPFRGRIIINKRLARGEFLLKRRSAFFLLALLFVVLSGFLWAQEDSLKIEVSVIPRKLWRGEEGIVFLKIVLQDGIIISPHPDFIIELKPCPELVFPKNFYTASDLGIDPLGPAGQEYLNLQGPVKIPFTVSLEAKRGSHILEGRIKYFARSKKEGWCVKSTAKFYAAFSTRSSAVKKKL